MTDGDRPPRPEVGDIIPDDALKAIEEGVPIERMYCGVAWEKDPEGNYLVSFALPDHAWYYLLTKCRSSEDPALRSIGDGMWETWKRTVERLEAEEIPPGEPPEDDNIPPEDEGDFPVD